MKLTEFNDAPVDELTEVLRACCDVPRWVAALRDGRPFPDDQSLLDQADQLARTFTDEEVAGALRAHPRIGERAQGESTEASWSRQEQSGVVPDDELTEVNAAYEERFDRVFLICATGLAKGEIVAAARRRLDNDDVTEAAEVKDELCKIALLRLRKVLDS